MGIRGLTTYVAAREEDCTEVVDDLTNVTLGVDLDSFLHFACGQLVTQYNSEWLILGGDPRALYVWVRDWMRPLFVRKIRLKFVRDPPGMLNTIKDVTHEKRSREKVEKLTVIKDGLYENGRLQPRADAAKNLLDAQAVFTLARQTLIRCLKHAGVSVVTAPTEADEALGDMLRMKKVHAILAHDSDYLLMNKMRYIPFSAMHVDPATGVVRATVFSAAKLAESSNISMDKLVEWAIVCGNDFTPFVDAHFDLAEHLHLPSLRQTQGYLNVGDALTWLQEHLGTGNWLDDPIFASLLAQNEDLLTHVYGIYCFYGFGKTVQSRFPHAKRHNVLGPDKWKLVSKKLDNDMLPFFAIDVMYEQKRCLSLRSSLLGLSSPILVTARASLYALLGQSRVEEFEAGFGGAVDTTRVVETTLGAMQLPTMKQHGKAERLAMGKTLLLEWIVTHPTVHAALAAWSQPKKKDEVKFIGYALGLVLAIRPEGLTPTTWHVLALTTIVSASLQQESKTLPFPDTTILRKEAVDAAALYVHAIELLLQLYRILNLHMDMNEHAYFSASLYAYLTTKYPWTKNNVRHILLDATLGLTEKQIMDCLWGYHTMLHIFESSLPAAPAPQLTPASVLQKTPKAVAKLKTKAPSAPPSTLPPPAPLTTVALAPLASPQEIDPLEWEDEVAPPKDLKDLIFTLPVFKHKDEILAHVAANPLVVIQGETGCGKSTSVPQFLLDENAQDANIYVTQPRRVAAITLAATVAKMRGQTVGDTIGYRVGQVQKDSSSTQITYVTTGYMLERLIHSPESVARVTHLILDEAHERSMDMDMLLLMLSTHWHLWPDLKLVIMSATMDSSIFFKYFKPVLPVKMKHKDELFVGSALHPVQTLFLDDLKRFKELKVQKLVENLNSWTRADMSDLDLVIKKVQNVVEPQLELCLKVAKMIVNSQGASGCILIFVSGLSDIQYLHEQMESWDMIQLFVLHSDIDIDDQAKAFENVQAKMKIILSTNIAESSVTIPDVTHIINTGLEKQIVMHQQSRSEVLVRSWVSRASVKQRSGRAGRIRPGVAYHLFTKQFMETCMDEYTTPELLRKPLDKVVLQLKAQMQHIGTPSELLARALSAPDTSNIESAFKVLHMFSAVASPNEKDDITAFGLFSVNFPLEVRLCRLLMYGLSAADWGLGVVDVVLLVAIMASPDLHISPSRFHVPSAAKFIEEMKSVLEAKLDLQEGNVWSEPLAIWQLMTKCLEMRHKSHVVALLRKSAISLRRFQTTLVLVGEICGRLLRLAKRPPFKDSRALQPSALTHLALLQKFSARMYSPDPWTYAHAPMPLLRLLVVLNYPDCLVRGKLPEKAKTGGAKGKKGGEPACFLTLKLDSTCNWGHSVPGDHFKLLLEQLMREPEQMKVTPNHGGFDVMTKPGHPVPFSALLLYFLRDRRFPVDLPVDPLWLPAEGDPSVLRIRFTEPSIRPGGSIHWTQWVSGVKVNVSGRSVFGLPYAQLDKKVVVGVFAEQLLTGDGSMMMGGCCTLLPPQVESYAAIVMLMTAKREVWMYMDGARKFWQQIKVDGQNYHVEDFVSIDETLPTINLVRQELSRGLVASLPTMGDAMAGINNAAMDALFQTQKKKVKGMKWVPLRFDSSAGALPFPPLVVS
ncbi:Aste57867_7150 [Aphanomyces stellatus]|uniref:Aste57867_7150 protein n=1 Tax=Aphanomyces stellatus TaxID=120398 RepID=A0A485KG59_9STRA|nr:hypothetical protein As57867_007126 [Aphanomyces stellatus]VFT84082.1 Aste57867_7150 [Aphanomyces stellatus]